MTAQPAKAPASIPGPPTAADGLTAHPSGRPRSPEVDRALIHATLAILEEEGYAGLSLAGVAQRAGVSVTALYRRWSSKEELVGASLVSLQPCASCPDSGSLAGDLDALLRQVIARWQGEPGKVLRGLIGEMVKSADLAAVAQDRLGAPGEAVLAGMLKRAVARGEIEEVEPGIARNLIIGPLLHRFLMEGGTGSPSLVDTLVPMMVAALKAGTS